MLFNYAVMEKDFQKWGDFPLLFWLDYSGKIFLHYKNIINNSHLPASVWKQMNG
jgi:hypothetical protein